LYTNGAATIANSDISGNKAGVLCIESTGGVSGQAVELEPVGGGVFSGLGTTTMNATFTNNWAAEAGGGIASTGAATITNSTFDSNSAGLSSGTDFYAGGGIASPGGGTITGSTFTGNYIGQNGNHCSNCAAVGGGFAANGTPTISASTFQNNHADCGTNCEGIGGGVASLENGIGITGSTFSGNTAGCTGECELAGGGAAAFGPTQVDGSSFDGNQADCEGECDNLGGGIFAAGVTLNGSQLTNNEVQCQDECAAFGGGFASATLELAAATKYAPGVQSLQASGWMGSAPSASQVLVGNVSIDESTLANNDATCEIGDCGASGGGGYADRPDTVDVNASTFNGNHALYDGGALSIGEAQSAVVRVVNSTVTQNISGFDGALDFGDTGVTTTLVYDTIVQNQVGTLPTVPLSQQAGGVHTSVATRPANLAADNLTSFGTIVALPNGGPNCLINTATTSAGYNFTDDPSCGFTDSTDKEATPNDPGLNALADNGGPTQTMLPQTGSPVIDAIPTSACQAGPATGVAVDQRGVTRPQAGTPDTIGCDIGAVEVQLPPPPPPPPPTPAPAVVVQPNFTG
jgi:predicted outer membrane repeat protein